MTLLDPAPERPAPPSKPATRIRYLVVAGVASAAASAYLTRVCISTAATSMQRDLGYSNETMGVILAAFSIGYFCFQVPGGWIGTRFGTRVAMPLISIAWSLCSLWTGLASSFAALWASRVGCGLAQGGLVPISARALLNWVPTSGRGAASAAVACSMSLGAVIASGLTAMLLPGLGWRGVFSAYSLVGIVWAALFYFGFRNRPEQHPAVNRSEVNLIRGRDLGDESPLEEPPPPAPSASRLARNGELLLAMATSPSMLLHCAQAFCRAFGAAFFITWFPAYLEKGRGVQMQSAGLLAMLPLIGTLLGNVMGGLVVDRLLVRTGSKRISRCGTAVMALGLCALCTLAAAAVRDPVLAVLTLALGSTFFGLGSPASWATGMDISGRHTEVVFGIQNMSGNIGAALCPVAVGFLFSYIQRHSADWNLVLYLFVGIYTLGAVCWAFLDPNRSAVERQPAGRGATGA